MATVTLKGETPLVMHADNIEWADQMEDWKNDPANKAVSKAGEDRTPPWRWIGCLNYDDPMSGVVTIPTDYIMSCVMSAAAQVPTGKGKGSFKALSQSGIVCPDFHWPLLVGGKTIAMRDIQALIKLKTFREHMNAVKDLGFTLLVKRARVGKAKHVRVRPRFDNWSTVGTMVILNEQITERVLGQIFEIAGRLKGLGDWRPGAPSSPGPWGTFTAKIE